MLGLTIFKRALPGNLRQVQASESALRVIFMVLHKVSNFTKKAVTDVNLPGARERGVLHRFDRGLLCRLNVRHLLNDHPRNYKISPQMVPYIDFTQKCPTLPLYQVIPPHVFLPIAYIRIYRNRQNCKKCKLEIVNMKAGNTGNV